MTLSSITVGPNREGSFSVLANGITMGPMYAFYRHATKVPLELARNRYPFDTEKNCFENESMAECALVRVKAHVSAVINMNPKLKIGSSKYWTL